MQKNKNFKNVIKIFIICHHKIKQLSTHSITLSASHTHTHTRLTALFPGLPGWAGTRKVKPIWILLKQETVSGGDISWAYASLHLAPDSITTPAPHHSVFYRPDALPAAQPTASKHWRHITLSASCTIIWPCYNNVANAACIINTILSYICTNVCYNENIPK